MYNCSKIDFIGNYLQFILIRSCTKNVDIANFVYYGKTRMLHFCVSIWLRSPFVYVTNEFAKNMINAPNFVG